MWDAGQSISSGKSNVEHTQQSNRAAAGQKVDQSFHSTVVQGSDAEATSNASQTGTAEAPSVATPSVQGPLQLVHTTSAVLPQPVSLAVGLAPTQAATHALQPVKASEAAAVTAVPEPVAIPAAVRVIAAKKPVVSVAVIPATPAARQDLQQTRIRAESVRYPQVAPAALPIAFAASALSQPGPLFLTSFPETSLDSSTTLPQANNSSGGSHNRLDVTAATSEANLWKSTVWGQGTAQSFGAEALTSFSSAIGAQGTQLTVLTLSYIDLGSTRMQTMCTGIARCL